jgi:hypothetical protein
MKLTESQIQELYKFTRKHYVYFYDVQTELVDHLANDIESIWIEKPKLTFEQARDESFKKFGVFGFMEVVEEKQKSMTKRYWKILFRFLKEWFSFPKIIITLSIFILFITLLKFKEAPFVLILCLIVIAIFEMVTGIIVKYKIKKRKQKNQNIFLLEEMIHKTKNGFIMIVILNIYNILLSIKIDFSSLSIYWRVFFSFFFTIVVISFYITEFIIPSKAEELLEETYPEYKLSKTL